MLVYERIIEKINENIDKIKKYDVKKIGLFGSYLRNQQNSESDVDILVEFEKDGITFDNYMDLKFFLEKLFNNKVDLVIAEDIKPALKTSILRSVKYAKGL